MIPVTNPGPIADSTGYFNSKSTAGFLPGMYVRKPYIVIITLNRNPTMKPIPATLPILNFNAILSPITYLILSVNPGLHLKSVLTLKSDF